MPVVLKKFFTLLLAVNIFIVYCQAALSLVVSCPCANNTTELDNHCKHSGLAQIDTPQSAKRWYQCDCFKGFKTKLFDASALTPNHFIDHIVVVSSQKHFTPFHKSNQDIFLTIDPPYPIT